MGIFLQAALLQSFLNKEQLFFTIVEQHETEQVYILQNRRHQDTHMYIRMIWMI